jgi:hypothetical protein
MSSSNRVTCCKHNIENRRTGFEAKTTLAPFCENSASIVGRQNPLLNMSSVITQNEK